MTDLENLLAMLRDGWRIVGISRPAGAWILERGGVQELYAIPEWWGLP